MNRVCNKNRSIKYFLFLRKKFNVFHAFFEDYLFLLIKLYP